MSCFKIIYYNNAGIEDSTYIDGARPADILTTFLTKEKSPTRWTDDFRLESLTITYKNDDVIVKGETSHEVVSFNTLEKRFNQTLEYLVKRKLIEDRISDLEALDDNAVEITKAGWRPHDLAVTLQFIATLIDVKKKTSLVSF